VKLKALIQPQRARIVEPPRSVSVKCSGYLPCFATSPQQQEAQQGLSTQHQEPGAEFDFNPEDQACRHHGR
jgi:hypothetical protein